MERIHSPTVVLLFCDASKSWSRKCCWVFILFSICSCYSLHQNKLKIRKCLWGTGRDQLTTESGDDERWSRRRLTVVNHKKRTGQSALSAGLVSNRLLAVSGQAGRETPSHRPGYCSTCEISTRSWTKSHTCPYTSGHWTPAGTNQLLQLWRELPRMCESRELTWQHGWEDRR